MKTLYPVIVGSVDLKVAATGTSSDEQAASSYHDTLKAMIEEVGYIGQTILNVDETGLFWKKMPKQTFTARKEKTFPGFKIAEDHWKVMIGGNATVDCKLKPLLVYCSENQEFKKINLNLACQWLECQILKLKGSDLDYSFHF